MQKSYGRIFSYIRKNRIKVTIQCCIVFFVSYNLAKLIHLYNTSPGRTLGKRNAYFFGHMGSTLQDISPSFTSMEFFYALLAVVLFGITFHMARPLKKNMKTGVEYGAAHWGNHESIAPYIDKNRDHNIILSDTEMLSMNGRMPNMEHNRNKNVLVIGGSGSGKTYSYVTPNLLQMDCSYVVTDPKGTIVDNVGTLFLRKHYKVKILNTINFAKSLKYNPFAYIREEKDVLKMANALFTALKGEEGGQAADPFWDEAAKLFIQAIIGFIWYEAPENEQNMSTFLELLNACEVREDDDTFKNAVDLLFEDLENELNQNSIDTYQEAEKRLEELRKHSTDTEEITAAVKDLKRAKKNLGAGSDHFAVRQWKKYKLAAGKTAKSILITVGSKFSVFDIKEVRELMEYNEMDLESIGEEKTILFIITSDTDRTFNFIPNLLYKQLFDTLCYKADNEHGGRLPVHVRCIMDEFANLGKINDWQILISTIRSREISADMILQSKAQLKSVYKDDAEIIEDNCDTCVFLGGKGKTTLKDIEEALGKETVDLFNETDTRGSHISSGINFNKVGRELMSVFELNVMPRSKCIVQISGVPPFYSNKYNTKGHPRYRYTADADKKMYFDSVKYVETLHTEMQMPHREAVLKGGDRYVDYGMVKETG